MLKIKADKLVACVVVVFIIIFLCFRAKMIEKENTLDRTDTVIVKPH